MKSAVSVGLRGTSTERIARGVADAVSRVRGPKCAIAFVCGDLAGRTGALGAELAGLSLPVPVAIVPAAGVLTQDGEVENDSAAAIIAWSGGRVDPLVIAPGSADAVAEALGRAVADRAGKSEPPVLVFAQPEGLAASGLEPLAEARGVRNVFGAGTVGPSPPCIVDADGMHPGAAIGLVIRGLGAPAIAASPACRLLGPLRTITEVRGSMVVSIDGEPALEVLRALGEELEGEQLLFAVLAAEEGSGPDSAGRPELIVRPVQGVDPPRQSILVGDEVKVGLRMTFGVKDGAAARRDLEVVTRHIEREIAGAAPRFGIYLNCAGRGTRLYDSPDVDSRILRGRFGDTPFAGMQSSFEIAPHLGRPTVQLYTGVLALFTTPS